MSLLRSLLFAFTLSLAISISCYVAAGVSLGLFFGPMLLIPFLVPTLSAAEKTLARRVLICAAIALPVIVIWGIFGELSIADFLRCGVVLVALIVFLAGMAALVERAVGPVYAAALIALFGIAWATSPVWLAPSLTGPHAQTIIQRLTAVHPLMTINGVLFHRFESWDRYPIAYQRLARLNQDILYTLPRNATAMVLLHGLIGATGFVIAQLSARNGTNRDNPGDES